MHRGEKEFTLRRRKRTASIESSSLWGAITKEKLPLRTGRRSWRTSTSGPWTSSAIQKGDRFTVIYDERFVDDSVSVGIGRIWGRSSSRGARRYYAIPFRQNEKIRYWEYDGASLRKQMLKAPLKNIRASARASPTPASTPSTRSTGPTRVWDLRTHRGTPVHAGRRHGDLQGWGGGGGNTLKIKHAGNLVTGYLHSERGYARASRQGVRVSQGAS